CATLTGLVMCLRVHPGAALAWLRRARSAPGYDVGSLRDEVRVGRDGVRIGVGVRVRCCCGVPALLPGLHCFLSRLPMAAPTAVGLPWATFFGPLPGPGGRGWSGGWGDSGER